METIKENPNELLNKINEISKELKELFLKYSKINYVDFDKLQLGDVLVLDTKPIKKVFVNKRYINIDTNKKVIYVHSDDYGENSELHINDDKVRVMFDSGEYECDYEAFDVYLNEEELIKARENKKIDFLKKELKRYIEIKNKYMTK